MFIVVAVQTQQFPITAVGRIVHVIVVSMMNREFTNRRKGLLLDKGDAVFVTQPRQRNGFMIHATENGLVVSEYVVPKNES